MNFISDTTYQKMAFAFFVGALVGAFGFWLYSTTTSKYDIVPVGEDVGSVTREEEGAAVSSGGLLNSVSTTPAVQSERIVVLDQSAGTEVVVTKAVFDEEGWVVIHEGTASTIGNALGAGRFSTGEQTGVIRLLRSTVTGNMYRAVLYHDNGDGSFDLDSDFPILSGGNQPILTTFIAR